MDNLPSWVQAGIAIVAAFVSAVAGAAVASWRVAEKLAETRHTMRNELHHEVKVTEAALEKLEERLRKAENDIAVLKNRRRI